MPNGHLLSECVDKKLKGPGQGAVGGSVARGGGGEVPGRKGHLHICLSLCMMMMMMIIIHL